MAKKELKTIDIRFTKKHLWFFIIGIIIISLLMNLFPAMFGMYEYQFVGCTNGTIEQVLPNKTIYCGENITEMGYTIVDGVFKK